MLLAHQRVLVTGAGGFIGSHVCERLLHAGHDVVGVDCFTDYYARSAKERNLDEARDWRSFELVELDLAHDSLAGMLDGIGVVIHLAAQPGVRHRAGDAVEKFLERNVLATRRLLGEAAASPVASFVYASSSSVYGDAPCHPTNERTPPAPLSAYGRSKAACERLAAVHARRHGVPAVGLRYFSVYGPRQRPDMAIHRFITGCLDGDPIPLLGDGRQVRDFTYVGDAVEATIAAAAHGRPGTVYNVGGGQAIALRKVIALIGELVGRPVEIERRPALAVEARRTGCDGTLALRELGFAPRTGLDTGIAEQLGHIAGERVRALAAI